MILLQVLSPSSGMLDYAVSLRPDYHGAILDTVRYYGWTNVIYMYDSHDGMSILSNKLLLCFLLNLWFNIITL